MWMVWWVACMLLSAMVLSPYDKAGTGFLLGLLLGPIGFIAAIVMRMNLASAADPRKKKLVVVDGVVRDHEPALREDERECPHCAELIKRKAKVCKHCGRDVEPLAA
jgi:hypothetical protein